MGDQDLLSPLGSSQAVLENEVTESDWLAAASALTSIAEVVGGEEKARTVLEELLRAGRLTARADLMIQEIDFGPIPLKPPPEASGLTTRITHGPVYLGPPFWSASASTYGDTLWKWREGVFAWVLPPPAVIKLNRKTGTYSSRERIRMVAFAVNFRRDQIVEMIAAQAEKHAAVRQTLRASIDRVSKQHSSKTTWKWHDAIEDLDALAREGSFETRGAQARLEKDISSRFHNKVDDSPSPSTTRRKARALIELNDSVLRQRAMTHPDP
jgi:hypothetical protein